MTIVKVNATVKRGHVAFSFTKRGVAFSLTKGKYGLFVRVEAIFKANWAAPPAGGVLRLVLQTFRHSIHENGSRYFLILGRLSVHSGLFLLAGHDSRLI